MLYIHHSLALKLKTPTAGVAQVGVVLVPVSGLDIIGRVRKRNFKACAKLNMQMINNYLLGGPLKEAAKIEMNLQPRPKCTDHYYKL